LHVAWGFICRANTACSD